MAQQRNDFPTKQEIKKAVLSVLTGTKLERKQIIDRTQLEYGYSLEQLKDRSCESLNTRLKSLTGVVINEMLATSSILLDEEGMFSLPTPDPAKTVTDGKPTRTQKRRAQRKKAAERSKPAHPDYPDSPLGDLLTEADAKLDDLKSKKIDDRAYIGHLKRIAIKCINEAGGEFFEELSMKLLIAAYGETVQKNELTAGADDNGIDGKLYVKDPLGFDELIFFQSKTKLNERAYVSIKVAREFLGVMSAYGASKGILITNSNFHRDTRAFASKVTNLMLIDANVLFDMMKQYGVGIINRVGTYVIDTGLFLSCK